jgi:hypothetical protein
VGLDAQVYRQLIMPPCKATQIEPLTPGSVPVCRPSLTQSPITQTQLIVDTPAPNGEIVPSPTEGTPLTNVNGVVFEGGYHPYYIISGEQSIYASECYLCGHRHCRCTYAPFGDSVYAAFSRQAYLGAVQLLSLYDYDFQQIRPELTPRGTYQLQKCLRQLEITPDAIKIQATLNMELDAARREYVIGMLSLWGISNAESMVTTVRMPKGRPSIETLETANGLLNNLSDRGRTIRAGGSAAFTGARFGQ